jgi:hypothetical protein
VALHFSALDFSKLSEGVFYFSSLMKTLNSLKKIVSLHIIVMVKNMKRIVSWLKVTWSHMMTWHVDMEKMKYNQ